MKTSFVALMILLGTLGLAWFWYGWEFPFLMLLLIAAVITYQSEE